MANTMIIRKRLAAAFVLAGTLVAMPAPAAARVTVTVEFAFGGAVAGGAGVVLYLGGYWEALSTGRVLGNALIEIGEDRTRFAVPIPLIRLDGGAPGSPGHGEQISVDLVRWSF